MDIEKLTSMEQLRDDQKILAETIGLEAYKKLVVNYAGSFIYDEYPDKINLNRTGRQICERLRKNEEFREIPIEDLFEASGHDAFMPPPPPPFGPPQGPPPPRPPRQQSWLEDIVSVLLYQEIARRRCRRCRGRY